MLLGYAGKAIIFQRTAFVVCSLLKNMFSAKKNPAISRRDSYRFFTGQEADPSSSSFLISVLPSRLVSAVNQDDRKKFWIS